jgi:hypothetical protein
MFSYLPVKRYTVFSGNDDFGNQYHFQGSFDTCEEAWDHGERLMKRDSDWFHVIDVETGNLWNG